MSGGGARQVDASLDGRWQLRGSEEFRNPHNETVPRDHRVNVQGMGTGSRDSVFQQAPGSNSTSKGRAFSIALSSEDRLNLPSVFRFSGKGAGVVTLNLSVTQRRGPGS